MPSGTATSRYRRPDQADFRPDQVAAAAVAVAAAAAGCSVLSARFPMEPASAELGRPGAPAEVLAWVERVGEPAGAGPRRCPNRMQGCRVGGPALARGL